jgi:hypothetical protein
MQNTLLRCVLVFTWCSIAVPANAVLVTYTNEATFLDATVSPSLESFESFAATNSRNLTNLAATDFTLSVVGGEDFGVFNQLNFNGTFATDGNNYVVSHTSTSSMTFDFSQPIAAFGLNITDFGDNAAQDLILDVGTDSFTIASGPLPNGNELFFGVVDFSGTFSSATLTAQGDSIGIDEVYTAQMAAVPEPSSLALLGLSGLTLVGGALRRRRQPNGSISP